MGEVRYSINGKYFKDYGIYVSSSLGLIDALKRKPIKTYDWPEYHGESLDLSNPKFEAREIVLNCFVKGDNYQEMFDNFRNVVLSEFQKSGTQRLLVEPFGYKAIAYEVYIIDDVKIAKEFSESTSIGVFSIKLIEPNPIKKVLYTTSNTLNLSYNSSKETEIFFVNGEKTTARGNVSLSGKVLASRNVSSYNFNGRNLLASTNLKNGYVDSTTGKFSGTSNTHLTFINRVNCEGKLNVILSNMPSWLTAKIYFSDESGYYGYFQIFNNTPISIPEDATKMNIEISAYPSIITPSYVLDQKIKLEFGTVATSWQPAPEDERYIIIAGDIDGITNLTTNATVLWEKL